MTIKKEVIVLASCLFLISCGMKKENAQTAASSGNYSIIWRYTIKPEMRNRFEHEYGSHGAWNELFSQSVNYRGSFLHHNAESPDTYILIDTWTDQLSYEQFKADYAEMYKRLSDQFSPLYISEERMGAFNSLP